jgi:membrane protein/epoxyqueuosine reductase
VRAALPDDPGLESFVVRNLRTAVAAKGGPQALSALMLIFSSNGVFGPLEVSLNRLWGFPKDRPYWRNVVLGLSFAVTLGLLFVAGTLLGTKGAELLSLLPVLDRLPDVSRRIVALFPVTVPFSMLGLLLVYWRLPYGRVPLARAARAAVWAGLLLPLVRAVFLGLWPYLGFREVYGPFFISVTLLVWGYVAALATLAVAEVESRRHATIGNSQTR